MKGMLQEVRLFDTLLAIHRIPMFQIQSSLGSKKFPLSHHPDQ
ncbi:hypothetical protein Sulac_0762 [Sulfobacillus acidophilus DSM 10332]|uniref:Uncharacterized protein n=1 Tax=Sulfobacillus acidophilus (strain ATCC 700253 / DSM 10332 / NAL) TaxID=679936 RepID=G8U135_SULAD|nr:hypothetical protein Sulac_0762 [Sulfobacillus acidophilus DSM 10332]